MNEAFTLSLAGLSGGLLGAIFFGGLWWTVRMGLTSTQPALWFLASMLLRMGVVLAGFYLVANHGMKPLLVCLLGFVAARLIVTQLTRTPGTPAPSKEICHAP